MQLLLKCVRLLNDKGAILSEQAEKYPHLFEIERKKSRSCLLLPEDTQMVRNWGSVNLKYVSTN